MQSWACNRHCRAINVIQVAAALLALGLVVVSAAPAHASEPPIPLETYWQRVRELQSLIDSIDGMPPELVHAQLLPAAERWKGITSVSLPDGRQVPLDHAFLVSLLRANPPDLEQLRGLLNALLSASVDWSQAETPPMYREKLERVLDRAEFQWQSDEPSPLDRFWQWLEEFLSRLLPRGGGAASVLGHLLTILGAAALAAALFYALRGTLSGLVGEAQVDPEAGLGGQPLTAATALKQAQVMAGARDYREAVRYLYLSTLLLLEERGMLRYDRSLTNREYLRSVEKAPQVSSLLGDIIDVFERVWYGYQPLDEADYHQYEARIAKLHGLR